MNIDELKETLKREALNYHWEHSSDQKSGFLAGCYAAVYYLDASTAESFWDELYEILFA